MRIVDGSVAELGPATALSSRNLETDTLRSTGAAYAFMRIARSRKSDIVLQNVVAPASFASMLKAGAVGRFAFYESRASNVLCGYSDGAHIEIAGEADDPLAIETDVQRTLGKRKIFFGVALIFTLIGLFFAFPIIRKGQAILKANPRVRRPSEAKLRRRLER